MIGKVRDNLFVLLDAVERDRAERVSTRSSMREGGDVSGSSGNRRGFVSSRLPTWAGWRFSSGVEAPLRLLSSRLRWSNTISSITLALVGGQRATSSRLVANFRSVVNECEGLRKAGRCEANRGGLRRRRLGL